SDSSRAFVVTDDGVSILDFGAIDKKAAGKSQQGTEIARTVSLGQAKTDNALDVSVTPDGRYALAREEGKSELRLLNLDSGDIQRLDVAAHLSTTDVGDAGAGSDAGSSARDAGSPTHDAGTDGGSDASVPATPPPTTPPPTTPAVTPITDLDLSTSGTFAVAVVRDKSAVVRLPIPGAFD